MVYEATIDGVLHKVALSRENGNLSCQINGQAVAADIRFPQPGVLSLLIDGQSYEIRSEDTADGSSVILKHGGKTQRYSCTLRDPRALKGRRSGQDAATGPKKITAPMPGKVVRILAPAGATVEAGQGIIVIEAMKMQNELKAPKNGKVVKILSTEGSAVNPGDTLAIIE